MLMEDMCILCKINKKYGEEKLYTINTFSKKYQKEKQKYHLDILDRAESTCVD